MAYIEQLPATQQLALRDALHAASGLVAGALKGAHGANGVFDAAAGGRGVGLLAEIDGRMRLTDDGRIIAEGRA